MVDVFSKFLWIEPLLNKKASSVAKAFELILEKGRVCDFWQTDSGKEFVNSEMHKLLKEWDIHYRVVRSPDVKCACVERVLRTIKEKIFRYLTYKNTKRYIDVLQSIVYSYNNSKHSSIRMNPADVNENTAPKIRERLIEKKKHLDSKIRKPKYTVGSLVRISCAKGVFDKGYEGHWSKELFVITRVLANQYPVVYIIKDLDGSEIDGFFYESELTYVRKNLEETEFEIDEILRSKGSGAKKQVLVSWKNYPSKFSSWIPASSVNDIKR